MAGIYFRSLTFLVDDLLFFRDNLSLTGEMDYGRTKEENY